MAFQIDPRIPLEALANPINIGESLTKAQENQLRLQALRDEYNAAKEEKLRQKQMRSGIQTDIEQIQRGIPAQYSPLQYQQTPQTGQMPYGMTGVLANERGQNMPQPQAFGEDILAGNFNLNREMVAPAVEGREPTYLEQLQIAARQALKAGDIDSAFKFSQAMQQQRIAEREQNAPVGNPYPVYDTSGNFVGTRIMTKSGQEMPFGQQGTTTVKPDILSAKDKAEREFQERKFRAEQEKAAKEIALKELEINLKANQPDPVEKASAIADARAEAKIRQDLVNDAANVTKTYQILTPMIDNALTIVKNLPPDMLQSKYQSMLAGTPLNKYLGNPEQQKAITDYNLMLENLRLFIEKPAGAISNYEQGILGRAIGILEGNYSVEQKESALKQVKGIFDNQNKVAENVLKQNKADKFIYNKEGKPLRFTKEANSQQRREYGEAIFEAKGDSELIREIQEHARELGVLE